MKTSRVSTLRREQIIEAAIAVIDEQGIQNLSLSEIEKRTGLARGQLMYYYRSKEEILLAVFDRLLLEMHTHTKAANGDAEMCTASQGWERFRYFLTTFLLRPPNFPAFHSLHHTFLSQIGHREDYRQRLASLYDAWRSHMAQGFNEDMAGKGDRPVSPRLFASLVQAILQGLAVQRAADPNSYDPQEMLDLVLDMMGGYLRTQSDAPTNGVDGSANKKPKEAPERQPHRPRQKGIP
jgi:AcrR family transcriptional regulator